MDLREVYLNGKQLKDECPMCGGAVIFYSDYTECGCSNEDCDFSIKRSEKYITATYSINNIHKKDKLKTHNWNKKNFYD